jgi:hypothetical protein
MSVTADRSERLELVTTVLLGVATAVSAWCTYEAQLWNSRQLKELARGSALQAASLQATEVGTRKAVADVTTFAAVLEAESRGDRRAARYIAEIARPAFRAPLGAWFERTTSAGHPEGTPFDDPVYRASILDEPKVLRANAHRALVAASAANANSDLYVMRTVMFALSLFFFGIAGQLRTSPARRLAVGIGALVLVLSTLSLTRLERAGRPHLESKDSSFESFIRDGTAGVV